MISRRTSFILFVLFICCAFAVNGVLAAQPKHGGTLVVASTQDPTGLDPITARGNASFQVIAQMYNGLTKYKTGTFEVEPALAESWQISADGLTYTFKLRKNVTFHDGTAFDADALFFNIDRILNKQNPHYPKGRMGQMPIIYGQVASYKVVDQFTFQFQMKKPYAPFLACLAMTPAGIISPEAVKKYGQDLFKNPVGTGPFVFKEWVKGDHITMTANPNYWQGKPYVDSLIYRLIPENSVRMLKLEKGEVQLLLTVGPNDVPRIQKNKDLALYKTQGMMICSIGINHIKKPLDDVRVRKALSYAINREEVAKYILKGYATPTFSPVPQSNWGYDGSLKGYPYDPEKAKALLKEAGHPNGFDIVITAANVPAPMNPMGVQTWQAIQSYWKKIGVNAKLNLLELGAYYGTLLSGKNTWEIEGEGWTADNGDPDAFLHQRFSSKSWLNFFNYKNPELDELLDVARHTMDPKERAAMYNKAQSIIIDKDCARIELFNANSIWASRANLKNFHPDQKSIEPLNKVWFE